MPVENLGDECAGGRFLFLPCFLFFFLFSFFFPSFFPFLLFFLSFFFRVCVGVIRAVAAIFALLHSAAAGSVPRRCKEPDETQATNSGAVSMDIHCTGRYICTQVSVEGSG